MPASPLERLDALAARLPFLPDDYGAANAAFARWREHDGPADGEAVKLWAYHYVYRYFALRFVSEPGSQVSDLDAVVSRVFLRIVGAFGRIADPGRYASYVSVACVNGLRNYHRDRRYPEALSDEHAAEDGTAEASTYDRAFARRVVAAAIAALPEGIRDVARLRFLEGLGYEAIAEQTGRPAPSVRAYVSRAAARLREHPDLRALYFSDVAPPARPAPDPPPSARARRERPASTVAA